VLVHALSPLLEDPVGLSISVQNTFCPDQIRSAP
jgi:hypothetical protein